MKLNVSKVKNLKFINFIGLTIAGIINSVGVTLFLMPVNLFDSGLSGLSMLVDKVTPEAWTISIFLLLFNFPFYLLGMKKQGLCFTIYSMYAIAIYSLFAFLFSKVFPIDFSNASPIAGNELCKQAFEESQTVLEQLIATIQAEAQKIQTLGDEFDKVDNQLASMVSTLGGK